ncbi:MAG: DNA-binding protein [Thermoproteus sp.]
MEVCEILGLYLAKLVEGARGNVVSFTVGDVSRWSEEKYRTTRSVTLRVAAICEALLAQGLLEKIGKKYILRRGSPLWEAAAKNDEEAVCDIVRRAIIVTERT